MVHGWCRREGLCCAFFFSYALSVNAVLGLGVPASVITWVGTPCNGTVKASQGSMPRSSAERYWTMWSGAPGFDVSWEESCAVFQSFLQWFVSSKGHGCCCISSWH